VKQSPSWKTGGRLACQNFPTFLWNRMFMSITVFTMAVQRILS